MCGILAVIGKYRYKKIPEALIERGRDDNGIYENENVQLIQTRLRITGEKISLPYQTKRYVLLFNGEIYNHRNYDKNEYAAIIKAYEQHGSKLNKKLDGQFFILIYDKKSKDIRMFNDEYSIQGAYIIKHKGNTIISSNLRSLPEIKFKQKQERGYGNVSVATVL